jgi:hypothetical protein
MNITVIESKGAGYAAGQPGEPLIQNDTDCTDVIGFCLSSGVSSLLVYPENLPGGFFELKTGEAGALLQKFRTYRIRVAAVVGPLDPGSRFAQMAAEENRGSHSRFFEDQESAMAWLEEAPGAGP